MKQNKWTTSKIRALKGKQKIVSLTAYDFLTARFIDAAGIHIALVGDSLAMTVLGYRDTLPVTVDEMLHHTGAVARGIKQAMVIADMPFLSYQTTIAQAIENAGRFLKEAGADAVKIEGGTLRADTVRALTQNGIPVMGHIGLTPQSVRESGGYKVQGKKPEQVRKLKEDALALEQAGAFSIVLEGIPAEAAREISETLAIPSIGIGAGPHCDGQVLVVQDMLGIFSDFTPKFVKRYARLGPEMEQAFSAYKNDVEQGNFPGPEHSYP